MLSRATCLALATSLTACSLVYNPSNLPEPISDGPPPPDVMPDSEDKLDANPALLELQSVFPAVIFEGTGTGGSRHGVITVLGRNIIPGAKITVAVHGGGGGDPMITIDDANTDAAANGNLVAAPFTIAVDPALTSAMKIRLDVTVTQAGTAATLTETTPGSDVAVLEIQGLDELTGDATPTGTNEFSEVDATSITAAPGGVDPLIIRARGGITVTGAITANANARTGGTGGNLGGTGGPLLTAGQPGAGPGGGKPSGGGGGFETVGGGGAAGGPASGNSEITTLALPNRSSGGAGADGGLLLAGGDGGGGGGSIELTAGGNVSVTTVEARGGNGTVGPNNVAGGGGSGGLILLRGAQIIATSTNVGGGIGLNDGSPGRSRADTGTSAAPAAAFRGPMLDQMTPIITKDDELVLTVFGKPNTSFIYKITSFAGNVSLDLEASIGPLGTNMFPVGAPLFRGLNKICAFVPNADLVDQLPEAQNCLEIVYLFTPD